MVEFRSQEAFEAQCLQAEHLGALVLPLDEVLQVGTYLDLCLQAVDPGHKRWFYVVVASVTATATTFKIAQRPNPRVPKVSVESRHTKPHQTTNVLPVTLHCTLMRRNQHALLMAALSDASIERAVAVISQLRALIAKVDAKMELNHHVDVCLHTSSGARHWFEGRVVNDLPAGYAIEVREARHEVERRWRVALAG